MTARPRFNPARRRLLHAAGALTLTFAIPRAVGAADQADARLANLPGSLKKDALLDSWIRIDANGAVTILTGKAELGQGIKTALIQLAAEELVVAPARIRIITADTGQTADEGYTAGSHSMQDSGTAIRHAAAQVRAILVDLAAARLGTPAARLALRDGVITAPGGARVGYGALVSGRVLQRQAAPQSRLRQPGQYFVLGRAFHRIDIPAKVTGGAAYVQDLRLPGMVHARVVRPPGEGAQLVAIDRAGAAAMAGVLRVVVDGRFIGVVARREYQAVRAAQALALATRWRAAGVSLDEVHGAVERMPSEATTILARGVMAPKAVPGAASEAAPKGAPKGAPKAAPSAARNATPDATPNAAPANPAGAGARTFSARYRKPFQLHGSIGPSCAVAQLVDGQYTVWTHSQGVFPLRQALAELVQVEPARIRCIHVEGSGCYGHNGADDVAADAVLLARALPGQPVRVQWMREDEHGSEPKGPPMASSVQATLDAGGQIVDWQYQVWSPPHNARPGKAGNLLAGTLLARPFAPPPATPIPQPEGGGDRNAIPLYALANAHVVHHFIPVAPLRSSALRSLGAYHNVFSIESFMDELALAAQVDPVAFRLRHMVDARARAVIELAARQFGWDNYRREPGRGRGFAFARYKNLGAYAAIALEVEVARETGHVRITRAVAAVDSGEIVSLDGIRNQIEGGVVQSCSWTLCEEVLFDASGASASRDWAGYPILRFPQAPDAVHVHVIERPGQPFLGTGEATQGPTCAAIANAICDASGARLRELPFKPARVKAALAAVPPTKR